MKRFGILAVVIAAVMTLTSCLKDEVDTTPEYDVSTAVSIVVNNDKVGLSVFRLKNNFTYNEFWVNETQKKEEDLVAMLPNASSYKTYVDNNSYEKVVFRNNAGEIIDYKFSQYYNLEYESPLFYYKDDKRQNIDIIGYGLVHAVDAADEEILVGFIGEKIYTGVRYDLLPVKAFYTQGDSSIMLSMAGEYEFFNGVTSIHKSNGNIYVAGSMNYPMYWENDKVKKLSNNRGVVNQIVSVGDDVYAVGTYNVNNVTTGGYAACYWKNGNLVVLEESAVANSIYVTEKDDVYVAGAKGRNDSEYKACYWVNGKRVDLDVKLDDIELETE